VVVTDGETALCFDPQTLGHSGIEQINNFTDLLFELDSQPRLVLSDLAKVVPQISQQHGEDTGWRGRGCAVIAVAYGGVDIAAQRFALTVLQQGKQAPQHIAGVAIFYIQAHGYLLVMVLTVTQARIAHQNGFAQGDAQRRYIAIGPHSHNQIGQQAAGIGTTTENGAGQFPGQLRCHIVQLWLAAFAMGNGFAE